MRLSLLSSLRRRPARAVLVLAGLGALATVAVSVVPAPPTGTVTVANETPTTTKTPSPTTMKTPNPTTTKTATPTRTKTATPTGSPTTTPDDADTEMATTQDATVPINSSRRGNAATVDSPPVESTTGDTQNYGLFDSTRTVQFRNRYSSAVNVAILYYSPDKCGGEWGDWEASGWYVLQPGETKAVLRTSNRHFAYYAKSADGNVQWPAQSQSGLVPVLVFSSAFKHCLNLGATFGTDVRMKVHTMPDDSGTSTLNLNR